MNVQRLLALITLATPMALHAQRPALSDTTRAYVSVDAPVIAITNVTVIDGTGAGPKADQTVIITNGRITAVGGAGNTTVPSGARVIDGAGHTLIPGLVGMHDHTFYTTAAGRRAQLNTSAPRLYLASGVTTVRTTGSISPYSEISLKDQVEKGKVPGPRMHISGPYLTGPDDVVERMHITTPEQARRVVNYWADEGATWFKVYTEISRENLRAITDAAHKRGVKVTGHLCSVGYKEAVEANIDALEHGLMANLEYVPGKQPDRCPGLDRNTYLKLDVNGADAQSTFKAMIAKGVAMTSTLAVYEISVPGRPPLDPRVIEAMSPDVQKEYMATRERLAGQATTNTASLGMLKKAMEYEVAFVKAGGLLAAGVDPTGNGGALPGYGDQRNYELLVEAGFQPGQAVQVMSANGAKVLGVDKDLGTVSVGKVADLVLVRGELARDPLAIRNVVTVFKGGVGYDSQKLIGSVKGLVGIR
ncbi:MAG: amidohydrolase family protein [Gemmatimonadetes bacterium]|nr:amidohydrolase family protein [Gemmatimonadota bacterium]